MGEGGGRSLPSANPDNVAAGGVTDARCGEGEEGGGGEGKGGMKQITAHSNPCFSFSLSFFPLCIRRGFDEKIPHVAVQNKPSDFKWSVNTCDSSLSNPKIKNSSPRV